MQKRIIIESQNRTPVPTTAVLGKANTETWQVLYYRVSGPG